MKHGKVVVEVRTRDIWSSRPTLEFGCSGDDNHGAFGIAESNFLGLGTQLSLGYSSDRDRDTCYLGLTIFPSRSF